MEELKALTDTLIREMKVNTGEVAGLRLEQQKVLAEHRALRRANRRERNWRRASVVLILAVVGVVAWFNHHGDVQSRKLSNQQAADLRCIAAHEAAQDSRSKILVRASSTRSAALRAMSNAQHEALTYALTANPSPARLRRLIQDWNNKTDAFDRADDAYNKANTANPVPQLMFSCSNRLDPVKTPTAHPTPTATATALATRTHAVPVPVPTTVVMPGATVTTPAPAVTVRVTRVRTVTRTVWPPSCVPALKPPCVIAKPK